MNTMTYLVTKKFHSNETDKRFIVAGFTDSYWKCKDVESGNIVMVRKSNLKMKGCNIQFYKES